MTDVTDQRLHVEEVGISGAKDVAPTAEKDLAATAEKDVAPTAVKEVAGSAEKEVAGSVLASGDTMFGYDYATEEERSIRFRMRSTYCKSPFIDPTRASEAKRESDKRKYEAFKKKQKLARYVIVNIGFVRC